jgi:hypothetical protein
MNEPDDDTRFRLILASYDDIRTAATDLIEALPPSNPYVFALRGCRRRANEELDNLARATETAREIARLKERGLLR